MHQLLLRKPLPSRSQHCSSDGLCHPTNAAQQWTMVSNCVRVQKTAELFGFCEDKIWHSWGSVPCGRGRKGSCGPDVQEEVAASVQVVGRVKSEKALAGNVPHHLQGLSLIFYAVGTNVSPGTMWAALLPGFDLQQAPGHRAFKHVLSSSSRSTVLKHVL